MNEEAQEIVSANIEVVLFFDGSGGSWANYYFIPQTMLLLHFHTPNYKIIPHHQKKGYDSVIFQL